MRRKHLPARSRRAAKAATTFIVNSCPIRPISLNRTTSAYLLAAEFFLKAPPLQFLAIFFQKDVTFLLYQVSIVVYVDFLHHPTFPRGATRGDFFCCFATVVKNDVRIAADTARRRKCPLPGSDCRPV